MTWSLIICVLVCVCGVVWSEKYRYFGGWGIDNNDNNNWLSPRYRSSNWLLFSGGSGRVRARESLKPIDWNLFSTFCQCLSNTKSNSRLKQSFFSIKVQTMFKIQRNCNQSFVNLFLLVSKSWLWFQGRVFWYEVKHGEKWYFFIFNNKYYLIFSSNTHFHITANLCSKSLLVRK